MRSLQLELLQRSPLSSGEVLSRSGLLPARCSVPDPQEAQLGAEVGSVSDVGEEVLGLAAGAGRHAGAVRHRVVVDVSGQHAAAFQQDSATGGVGGVSGGRSRRAAWARLLEPGVGRGYLLARRMLTCGVLDSGSGTQAGWIRPKSSASSWLSLKQHTPTEGPTATTMLLTWQPNSVTMVATVAMATPSRVPFQPGVVEKQHQGLMLGSPLTSLFRRSKDLRERPR